MQEAAKTYAKEITSLNAALARDLNKYSNVLLLKQKRRIEPAGEIEGDFMGQSYVTDPTELDHIFGTQIDKAYGVNNTYQDAFQQYRDAIAGCEDVLECVGELSLVRGQDSLKHQLNVG